MKKLLSGFPTKVQVEENEAKEINKLRFNEESRLFALEREKGLESIIGNIYQSFDGLA